MDTDDIILLSIAVLIFLVLFVVPAYFIYKRTPDSTMSKPSRIIYASGVCPVLLVSIVFVVIMLGKTFPGLLDLISGLNERRSSRDIAGLIVMVFVAPVPVLAWYLWKKLIMLADNKLSN